MIYDETVCELGEGPFWHPTRKQFFWFDILSKRLHTKGKHWQFEDYVSAAGWVDHDRLLVASDRALFLFDLETAAITPICNLEHDNPVTRSNDGRADPWGGFWIGTMGINAEPNAGAIYRYFNGELQKLYGDITITNAICFSPDRKWAYYTDTASKIIKRQALEPENGWPVGDALDWLDLTKEGLNPDGAVVDAKGNFWNAQWGASRVACYTPEGEFKEAMHFAAAQTSCPAFGGDDLRTMYCTTAAVGLSPEQLDEKPESGKTFRVATAIKGQAEHQVKLK